MPEGEGKKQKVGRAVEVAPQLVGRSKRGHSAIATEPDAAEPEIQLGLFLPVRQFDRGLEMASRFNRCRPGPGNIGRVAEPGRRPPTRGIIDWLSRQLRE